MSSYQVPKEYKPITPIGYIGYQLLFSIPIIGLIFLIIFASCGTNNINVKNFARSYFVVMIFLVIIIFILVFIFGVSPSTTSNYTNYVYLNM